MRRLAYVLFLTLAPLGCAPDSAPDPEDDGEEFSKEELGVAGFDRNRVMSDSSLTDGDAMDEQQIQAFLDNTPYGTRSRLATYSQNGISAASAIAQAAQDYDINPIAILTRAQMEQSLIAKTNPSQKALDWAFGCGCPDNKNCDESLRGFNRQVQCMASWTRGYIDDLAEGGSTIAGWKVGKAKKTLDGKTVTPMNVATAALYTYTPWVGTSGFGNLSHFLIWNKFAKYVEYFPTDPSGCTPLSFPSGLVAMTLPDEALTEAYSLAFSIEEGQAPTCFLDVQHLEDPISGVVAGSDAKVASNFRMVEFMAGETMTRNALVSPELVQRLQTFRTALGAPVKILDAFRSPERHIALCEPCTDCTNSCDDMSAMSLGMGALVSSDIDAETMLQRAAAAGFSTCRINNGVLYVDVQPGGGTCP